MSGGCLCQVGVQGEHRLQVRWVHMSGAYVSQVCVYAKWVY